MSIRQQAIATAHVYIRRYYIKVEIRRTNPYLVMATALYLACKMEECPLHIRVMVSEARNIWPGTPLSIHSLQTIKTLFQHSPHPDLLLPFYNIDFIISDVSKLGETEFSLISETNSHLIIHHPYRTLTHLSEALSMAAEEVSLATSIINDHYLTDLPLLFAPHIIAITAIFLSLSLIPTPGGGIGINPASAVAAVAGLGGAATTTTSGGGGVGGAGSGGGGGNTNHKNKIQGLVSWLAEGEIDIKSVVDCAQELIGLYQAWEVYNEKACKEGIARFVKGRGLDK